MTIKFAAMKILKIDIIYEEGRKHNNESCIQRRREEKKWFCYNRKKMIIKNLRNFDEWIVQYLIIDLGQITCDERKLTLFLAMINFFKMGRSATSRWWQPLKQQNHVIFMGCTKLNGILQLILSQSACSHQMLLLLLLL